MRGEGPVGVIKLTSSLAHFLDLLLKGFIYLLDFSCQIHPLHHDSLSLLHYFFLLLTLLCFGLELKLEQGTLIILLLFLHSVYYSLALVLQLNLFEGCLRGLVDFLGLDCQLVGLMSFFHRRVVRALLHLLFYVSFIFLILNPLVCCSFKIFGKLAIPKVLRIYTGLVGHFNSFVVLNVFSARKLGILKNLPDQSSVVLFFDHQLFTGHFLQLF